MSLFDFDNDGELDPLEFAVGASIIGDIGYDAGLSASEEKAERLRNAYENELKDKQDRIDELEDELDELRESYSDNVSLNSDWDDDIDDDDGFFDDFAENSGISYSSDLNRQW